MPPPPVASASLLKKVVTDYSQHILRRRDPANHFNLLLFGAPGVGKGTFAKLIQRDFLFKPFSTGDYFRQVVATASQGGEVDAFTSKM